MAKITYIEINGTEHVVDVANGLSVMRGAKLNDIPGIDADCGGGCACGTCHVYVDPEWMAAAGGQGPLEAAMLEVAENLQPNSRLSCQINVSDALDGLILRMPESQK